MKTSKTQLQRNYFSIALEGYSADLAESFASWQAWQRRLAWFNQRSTLTFWLLGGSLTRKILEALEASAEDTFWNVELQYH